MKQLDTPQKTGELFRVGWLNEIAENRAADDFDELVDRRGRGHERESSALRGVGNLPPPAFDEGTDQDRGVEDRSDNGVSLRTSRTSASILSSSTGLAASTLQAIRSQMARHRSAQVRRSIASATRSCSSMGRAFTCSTIDSVRGSDILLIIRDGGPRTTATSIDPEAWRAPVLGTDRHRFGERTRNRTP